MPNAGHYWTDTEEQDALLFEWDDFALLYPTISKAAYRARRKALDRKAGGLFGELVNLNYKPCKVCRFLAGLSPVEANEWRGELAKSVSEISHVAVKSALSTRGVDLEESSVRRHRRNHRAK